MLNKRDALDVRTIVRANTMRVRQWLFRCFECGQEIWDIGSQVEKHSGRCRSCGVKNRFRVKVNGTGI